jgi:hypothetical protein
MITAKVKCYQKTETGAGADRQVQVGFNADYANGRNQEWSLYTPALNMAMTLKGEVADRFEIGKAYTLEFVENDD